MRNEDGEKRPRSGATTWHLSLAPARSPLSHRRHRLLPTSPLGATGSQLQFRGTHISLSSYPTLHTAAGRHAPASRAERVSRPAHGPRCAERRSWVEVGGRRRLDCRYGVGAGAASGREGGGAVAEYSGLGDRAPSVARTRYAVSLWCQVCSERGESLCRLLEPA